MKDPSRTNQEFVEEMSAPETSLRKLELSETDFKHMEAEFLRSEETYRPIFENAVEGIFQTTPEGKFLAVNPSYVSMFGYSSPEEFTAGGIDVGKHVYANPDDRTRFKELIDKQGVVRMLEFPALKKDGTRIWVSLNARAVRDDTGTVLYYEGTIEDITSLKMAEETIRESEEKYRLLIDNSHEVIYTLTPQGVFTFVSPAWTALLGYPVAEAVGKQFWQFVHPDDVDKCEAFLERTIETGQRETGIEYRVRHADGSWRWHNTNGSPLRDSTGTITGFEGCAGDITLRRRAEEELKSTLERLKDGEATLSAAVNAIHDSLIMIDHQGTVLLSNTIGAERLGKSVPDLLDTCLYDHLPPDVAALRKEHFDTTFKTGEPVHFEDVRSGRYFESYCCPIVDEGGKISRAVIFAREITAHKLAQERLKQQSNAMEASADGMAILNKDQKYVYLNRAHVMIYGYDTAEELLGQTWHILYDGDEQQRFDQVIMPEFKRNGRWQGEATGRRKDGSLFPEEVSLTALDDGGLICIARDITERNMAEKELRTTHQRLFDIIEFLPDATFVIDEEKKVVAWNHACEEMTGVHKEEIIGKGDYAYSVPFYGERRPILIDHVTIDSNELQQKYTSIERNEHLLYAEAFTPKVHGGKGAILSGKASPLFDRTGKVAGAIESIRDITAVKQLETSLRQAQKMESIGTLAGGIAHDFNNILTSLMGYASLIQMKMDDGNPLQAHVSQILSASQKAADLTRSLLTFSRKQPVTLLPLDINDTIEEMKKLLTRLLTEDIELRTSLTKDDTVIMADRSQVDQILFNLVTNARDAMPKGGTLIIETGITDMDDGFTGAHGFGKPGRYLLLTVSDTGTGMDQATKEKIFDPFFTTKETGKGTGLGLATVYGVVKQHNGYITAYSELGHGTTFRVYLPAAYARVNQEQHDTAPVRTGSETILIAEDDKEVRHFIHESLEHCGYKTIEAIDGQDAINKFQQHRDVDLVIVDSVMPKKNGREVCQQIRAIDPNIKVLFTSGYTKDIVLDKGIADKEFDFIAKPLSLTGLLQKVREVLDR